MAIEWLKRGKPDAERTEDDAKVRASVEGILKDIETRGDAAVRELSEKFDSYTPERFRLSEGEIEGLMSRVSTRDMADIRFAQAQVRRFAEAQRESMRDIEIETLPGMILGHRNLPVWGAAGRRRTRIHSMLPAAAGFLEPRQGR
jgi:sulfopropanediol 3-dehydrogenase